MADNLLLRILSKDMTARGFASATRGIKTFSRSVTNILRRIGSAVKWAIVGIAALGTWAVKSFMAMEQAQLDLEATIRSTGGAAGYTAKEMTKMAYALQKITIFSDTAIMSGQAMLATFMNIKGIEFEEATHAMLNLAAKMKQEPRVAAIMLGKALNNPTKGITALTRVGVEFTKEQIKEVKAMQKTGDMAGAQKAILRELNREYGSLARTLGMNGVSGAWIQFKNAIGAALQAIGKGIGAIFGLEGGFRTLAKVIYEFIESNKFGEWIDDMAERLKPLREAMAKIFSFDKEIRQQGWDELKAIGSQFGEAIWKAVKSHAVEFGELIAVGFAKAVGSVGKKAKAKAPEVAAAFSPIHNTIEILKAFKAITALQMSKNAAKKEFNKMAAARADAGLVTTPFNVRVVGGEGTDADKELVKVVQPN